MLKSETIGKIAEALALAQSTFPAIPKTVKVDFTSKTGTRVKYSYAELADILEAIRKPLSDNKLAVSQFITTTQEGQISIETLLAHASGEWLSSVYTIVGKPADPQGMGSLISYGRRYAVGAIVNIATETDDDAQSAMPAEKQPKKAEPKSAEVKPEPVKEQPPTGTTPEHFCKDHNVPFKLMTGKTDPNQHWYSHKAPDGKWCNERTSTPDASKQTDVVVDDAPLFPDDKPTEKPITEARKFDWQKVTKLAGKMGLKTVAQIPKALGIAKSGDWHGTEEQALDKIYEFAQLNGYQGAPWREIEL